MSATAARPADAAVRRPIVAIRPARARAGLDIARTRPGTLGGQTEELVRYEASVDLLVLGSHKYGPSNRLLENSTAQRLADEAPCPLLVLSEIALTVEPAPDTAVDDADRA